jgi:hypothetical protein
MDPYLVITKKWIRWIPVTQDVYLFIYFFENKTCSWHNQESNLASRTCNTSSFPLDRLTYTRFNSFLILLNSFSSRVELINNDARH